MLGHYVLDLHSIGHLAGLVGSLDGWTLVGASLHQSSSSVSWFMPCDGPKSIAINTVRPLSAANHSNAVEFMSSGQ